MRETALQTARLVKKGKEMLQVPEQRPTTTLQSVVNAMIRHEQCKTLPLLSFIFTELF